MPSCWPLIQPQRRACRTATTSSRATRSVRGWRRDPGRDRRRPDGRGTRCVHSAGTACVGCAHDTRAASPHPAQRPAGPRRRTARRLPRAGGVHVAATVEQEAVVARVGPLLEQVDAAVHEAHHRIVGSGPPVAIRFGGLVAGERQRRQRVDEGDSPHTTRRQGVGRRDAGNAGAADDDVARSGHGGKDSAPPGAPVPQIKIAQPLGAAFGPASRDPRAAAPQVTGTSPATQDPNHEHHRNPLPDGRTAVHGT